MTRVDEIIFIYVSVYRAVLAALSCEIDLIRVRYNHLHRDNYARKRALVSVKQCRLLNTYIPVLSDFVRPTFMKELISNEGNKRQEGARCLTNLSKVRVY